MWNTLRAIKDEALATAKELRDAHNPDHWNNEDDNDHGHPNAFQGPTSLLPPAAPQAYPNLQPPLVAPQAAPTAIAPPPISAPSATQPPAGAPPAREDDVTARLAALKAKLAAKTTIPRTEPAPAIPAVAPPSTTTSTSAPAVDTTAVTNLQHQLENERRHFNAQLKAARNEIAHTASQCQSLQRALAEAEARAVEAEEVTRAHHGATDEEHEQVIASLRAEIQAAKEETQSERSKASMVSAQAVELQERIDRAEAAAAGAGDHNELENELVAARMETTALREELERVRAQSLAAATATSISSSLPGGGETNTAEIESLRTELETIRQALVTAEQEKNAARQQLSRLKNQMLSEQDEEEEKIKWRVEAEVKLALEKMGTRAGGITNGSRSANNIAENEDLHAALERAERAEEEAARWEQTASARDAELANLQRALGEMSYESDAAERLRAELRAMQAEVYTLRNELDATRVSALSAENKVQQAHNEVAAARGDAKIARDAETEAKREVLAARVAAQEALKELQDLRKGGGTVDRSTVIQLIAGVMVQKRPKDALNYAINAINLSNEEVESIKTSARQTPSAGGGGSGGGVSLASSWIDFLESAVQEDGSTTTTSIAAPALTVPHSAVPQGINPRTVDPFAISSLSQPGAPQG